MDHPSDHLLEIISRHDYPEAARRAVLDVERRLAADPAFARHFDRAVCLAMGVDPDSPAAAPSAPWAQTREPVGLGFALGRVSDLAKANGVGEELLQLVFLLRASEILKSRYAERGVPESRFWDSVEDFKFKLLECMECRGKPGTFVAGWNEGLLRMQRFTYGRFQYETAPFPGDDFATACGRVVRWGETVVNFHIPSSGVPLSDAVRLASYREAWQAYRDRFPDGRVVFLCTSWLLYPAQREFLPASSNILKFIDDFEIVRSGESDKFGDAWRIFGAAGGRPPEEWPRDTSLRRAYADWILSGRKAGWGWGLIVFDGEKIVRAAE